MILAPPAPIARLTFELTPPGAPADAPLGDAGEIFALLARDDAGEEAEPGRPPADNVSPVSDISLAVIPQPLAPADRITYVATSGGETSSSAIAPGSADRFAAPDTPPAQSSLLSDYASAAPSGDAAPRVAKATPEAAAERRFDLAQAEFKTPGAATDIALPARDQSPLQADAPPLISIASRAQPPNRAEILPDPTATQISATPPAAERAPAAAGLPTAAAQKPPAFVLVDIQRTSPTTIEIRLDPPELGALTVEIVREPNGDIRAIVSAERGETLSLARRHAEPLAQELAALGERGAQIEFRDEGSQKRDDAERRPQRYHVTAPDRESDAAFNNIFAAVKGGVDIIA
jgi:hypothetical protein